MDKRFFLALLLTAIVIIAPPLLFQRSSVRQPASAVDSSRKATARADDGSGQATRSAAPAIPPIPNARDSGTSAQNAPTAVAPVETTTVETRLARYRFSSKGAVPISVTLDSYPSRRPGAAATASQLLPASGALARYRLALGADPIALDTIPLRAQSAPSGTGAPSVVYSGAVAGRPLSITYTIASDSFLVRVGVTAAGAQDGSQR